MHNTTYKLAFLEILFRIFFAIVFFTGLFLAVKLALFG